MEDAGDVVAAVLPRTDGAGAMKRIAIFGNAGGGKSTLAKRLAALTALPIFIVDKMQFRDGGAPVPADEFARAHDEILRRDEWIIDGFGGIAAAWARFERADTLVHVDLPLALHAIGVTARLIKGQFAPSEGWPANSPIWRSSLQSYKVLWPCHRRLTPRYRRLIAEMAASKRVHHLRSRAEIAAFLDKVARERAAAGHDLS